MPLMYHKDATESVNVHESQIATMEMRGWSEKPPVKAKSKPKQKDENGSS
jgi:hypothetical protein